MSKQRMTVEQMEVKYPNEWLFIIEPETLENTTQLVSGIVQVHSKSRDVINNASRNYKGNAAIRFMGEWTTPERNPRLTSYTAVNRQ